MSSAIWRFTPSRSRFLALGSVALGLNRTEIDRIAVGLGLGFAPFQLGFCFEISGFEPCIGVFGPAPHWALAF